MLRLTRAQILPIGLDLGLDSVKLLQLSVQSGQLSVHAAARRQIPADVRGDPSLRIAASMELIRNMLRENPFSGRRVVVALPTEIVHVKNLRLPMMPAAEVTAAVEFEARNIFPFDTEHAVIRHLPAGDVRHGADTKLEVIALAVKKIDIDSFVQSLHSSGCIIESLDFEPSALYRGVERFIRRREDEGEVHVLVDIGGRRTQVIIGRGRDISFVKPIEIGSMHLQDAVAKALEISVDESRALRRRLIETAETEDGAAVRQAVSDAMRSTVEEIAREIALCLRYYSVTFRGQRPAKVKLLGGESADPMLRTLLAAALPIPVEPARPLHSVNLDRMKLPDRRGYLGEWAVAFGLGLKLTDERFGTREGKRRDENPTLKTSQVEVVDVESAGAIPGKEPAHA